MRLGTALTLGRASNLPTVWSNLLAGLVLAGRDPQGTHLLGLGAALSLLYLAGMFLNDAFDAAWDATHRPERPIPRGEATAPEVFAWGGAMIAAALAVLLALGVLPFAWGLALSAAIVVYDWCHKTFGLAPWLMGLCRMLVYLVAASTLAITPSVMLAGIALLAYVAAITYTARTEHLGRVSQLWPLALLFAPAALALSQAADDTTGLLCVLGLVAWIALQLRRMFGADKAIGRAVSGLIAGIGLVDAAFIASTGASGLALWGLAACSLTLLLQRIWSGT